MIKLASSVVILLLFVAWTAHYVYENASDFEALLNVPARHLLALAALALGALYVNGAYLRIVVREFDVHLSRVETMGVSVLSTLANYVIPFRGGAGIRAVYLKRRHGFPYTHFAGITMGSYVIVLYMVAVVGAVSMGLVYVDEGIWSGLVLAVFGTIFLGMTVLILIRFRLPSHSGNRLLSLLRGILDGWERLRGNRALLLKIVLLTVLNIAIGAALFYVEFRAIGLHVSFVKCLLYACAGSLGQLIGITPNALGIREGVLILTGQILHATPDQMLMVSLLDRGIVLACTLVLSLYFSPALLGKFGMTLFTTRNDDQ